MKIAAPAQARLGRMNARILAQSEEANSTKAAKVPSAAL